MWVMCSPDLLFIEEVRYTNKLDILPFELHSSIILQPSKVIEPVQVSYSVDVTDLMHDLQLDLNITLVSSKKKKRRLNLNEKLTTNLEREFLPKMTLFCKKIPSLKSTLVTQEEWSIKIVQKLNNVNYRIACINEGKTIQK